MEIKILPKDSTGNSFSPKIGDRTIKLIDGFKSKLSQDGIDRLDCETVHILSHCTDPQKLIDQDATHLVVGYVQSGKTMSFTTLSALAADNGYRIIIYFAGTKNNLLSQTTKRIKKDLISNNRLKYKIYENPTASINLANICSAMKMSTKPTILITVLKHPDRINDLAELLDSKQLRMQLGKQGALIIDDEADQASLNGFASANSKEADNHPEWSYEVDVKESSTYSSISNLRSMLPNHSYVQYTATPQAPLLISILDLLSPKTHTVLTPGEGYTGGKTFFRDRDDLIISIPEDEVFHIKDNKLETPPPSFIKAMQLHILGVALVVFHFQKKEYLTMMAHADRQVEASEIFDQWAKNLKESWSSLLELSDGDLGKTALLDEFQKVYENEAITSYSKQVPSFDEIKEYLADVVNDTVISLVVSKATETKDIDWEESCTSRILIGADMLNRGFTVENLAITYMPRHTKGKSTADTIQQRCRFFGYKSDYIDSCRVFLPDASIIEYTEYVDHEEEMRQWLMSIPNLVNVERQLLLSNKLNPTRKNVLSTNIVRSKLQGWHQMNSLNYIEHNLELVENFIQNSKMELWHNQYETIDRNHRYAIVPIEDAIEFIREYKFGSYPDAARKAATLRYLQHLSMLEKDPVTEICFVQMAYKSEYRVRSFDADTKQIKQLFTGRSTSGSEVYPGDREIKSSDMITVQLHKLKLNCKEKITYLNGKIAYTIAVNYPEDLAAAYISLESQS